MPEGSTVGVGASSAPPKRQNVTVWIGLLITLGLALTSWAYSAGGLSNRIEGNEDRGVAQGNVLTSLSILVAQNDATVDTHDRSIQDLPDKYVPRKELDLKLEVMHTQMEAIADDVQDIKEQSKEQTNEILRELRQIQSGQPQ